MPKTKDIMNEIASSNWVEIAESFFQAIVSTVKYYIALYEFIYLKKEYSASTVFGEDTWAKVQVYSLSLIFKLWSLKHYRSESFQQDMIDNLKNVGIPGTGVPLSIFCYNYWTCLFFIVFFNPLICFCGALNKARKQTSKLEEFIYLTSHYYVNHLTHPDDWFSLWRLNCRLVSLHSYTTQSTDYRQEDKWTFLTTGKDLGVPVTPYIDTMETLVCKNKNIEGGMGIYFYKNASFGGEWILQEKLANADWLNALLPGNAPLSTMRVITTSTWSLSEESPMRRVLSLISSVSSAPPGGDDFDVVMTEDEHSTGAVNGSASNPGLSFSPETKPKQQQNQSSPHSSGGSATSSDCSSCQKDDLVGLTTASSDSNEYRIDGRVHDEINEAEIAAAEAADLLDTANKFVRAESGILRLGRMDAKTDHSSVLYDVDLSTGLIGGGTTNSHWYQLGVEKARHCPWLPPYKGLETHPDGAQPQVKGQFVPDIQAAIDVVVSAHFKMMPDVPIVGWDVAFTPGGIYLLEVNLSCNFFRGSFDVPQYIDLVDRYWRHLEKVERLNRDCQESEKHNVGSEKRKYKRN